MNTIFQRTALLALVAVVLAAPAAAQFAASDTVNAIGRSAWEEGALDMFHLTRDNLGARARAMGGAGLSLEYGVESMSLNPAAILGSDRITLSSEARIATGGAGVVSFPAQLLLGPGQVLDTSGYRVSQGFALDYGHVSLGIPLILLGERGTLGISYRRHRFSPQQTETRFEATGPVTNDIPATVGIGNRPDGGYDALSFALARRLTTWWDIGINANFESGTLKRDTDVGAAVFGQVVTEGSTFFSEDFRSQSFDVGTRFQFGGLSLGAVAFLPHTIKYDAGVLLKYPLPDPQVPDVAFRVNQPIPAWELEVPIRLGFGAGYEVTSQFTVAADFWSQKWSEATINRRDMTPMIEFDDPADSSTFNYSWALGAGNESFQVQMSDATSLRLGAEYEFRPAENIRVPVWLGYRQEEIQLPQVAVSSDVTQSFPFLVDAYWRYVENGNPVPDGLDMTPEQIEAELLRQIEYSQAAYYSESTKGTFITLGAGVTWNQASLEMSVESRSYDYNRFFFAPFDPTITPTGPISPFATEAKETRSTTAFSFAVRWAF